MSGSFEGLTALIKESMTVANVAVLRTLADLGEQTEMSFTPGYLRRLADELEQQMGGQQPALSGEEKV